MDGSKPKTERANPKETEIVRRLNHASSNHSKRGSRFDALNNEDLEGEDIIISKDNHNLSDQIDQPQNSLPMMKVNQQPITSFD